MSSSLHSEKSCNDDNGSDDAMEACESKQAVEAAAAAAFTTVKIMKTETDVSVGQLAFQTNKTSSLTSTEGSNRGSSSSECDASEDPERGDSTQEDSETSRDATSDNHPKTARCWVHCRLTQCSSLDPFLIFLIVLGVGLLVSIFCIVIFVSTYHQAVFGRKPPCPSYNNNHTLIGHPFNDAMYKASPSPTMAPTTMAVGHVMERLQAASGNSSDFSIVDRASPQYQALVWLSEQQSQLEPIIDNDQLGWLSIYSLTTLYFATNGKSWRNASGWLSTAEMDICEWAEVECDVDFRRHVVVALDLSNGNLAGTLPTEIGFLTDLTILTLSNNHLKGSIPIEIAYLKKLRQLHLDNNRFSGSLPVEIAMNLPKLEAASFHDNDLVAGLRNFHPCDASPSSLTGDCGRNPKEENSPPKVLCPCCTTCCYQDSILDDHKNDDWKCEQHDPYADPKNQSSSATGKYFHNQSHAL
jgi:Leucine rich repeat